MSVSQSALSAQIKSLEEDLGHQLFAREGRALKLTEAGRLALSYAETIFSTGSELTALLRDGQFRRRQSIRIGAVATLSRNFQENFVRPLLARDDVELVLQSGSLTELLTRLSVHSLDLVLSNRRVHHDGTHPWRSYRIARQPVSLIGKPRGDGQVFRFPEDLMNQAVLLPSPDSDIRARFDLICEQLEIRFTTLAEVDDMAMLRLLARDSNAIALLPSIVVQDELRNGSLVEYCLVPHFMNTFMRSLCSATFSPPIYALS